MKKWSFILNPVAGAGRLKKKWPAMRKALKATDLNFEEYWTQSEGGGKKLAMDLISRGNLHLVGVGGDGTNNEIINGILEQQSIDPQAIEYTLLPFGTGNDWVRTHKIPHSLKDWVSMLRKAYCIDHDVGWVEYQRASYREKRYFANVAGMAYDAHVVKVAEGYSHNQKRKLLYLWLVLKELFGFNPPALKLSFNGETLTKNYYTINVGICKYSGGGMQLVSHADPQGGRLALTLIRKFPKWRVILDTPKLFSGRLERHRFTRMAHTKALQVSAVDGATLLVEVDGEILGEGPLSFGILPGAIRVVVPAP